MKWEVTIYNELSSEFWQWVRSTILYSFSKSNYGSILVLIWRGIVWSVELQIYLLTKGVSLLVINEDYSTKDYGNKDYLM